MIVNIDKVIDPLLMLLDISTITNVDMQELLQSVKSYEDAKSLKLHYVWIFIEDLVMSTIFLSLFELFGTWDSKIANNLLFILILKLSWDFLRTIVAEKLLRKKLKTIKNIVNVLK